MIRYRRPKQDDEFIMRYIDSQLVPLSHLNPVQIEAVRKEIPKRLGRGITLIACQRYEDNPIGFVHFFMHGELLYIDMLAVAPESQRKKWGNTLMVQAEKFAASRGCKRSKVMVDAGNAGGLSFYKKLGYVALRYHTQNQCHELEKTL
ncbi:GNAT family N-acetyltransferase [Paenibacillus sp. KQZ6P-2]|uniref:GNAT family N-acetyltransferase n=1 Tax=Paenibacillus mangrovi TaxID=2931978 RepID=A0A9X2B3U2_9BACL|nr:GNAT family N-acetyltransferase [Paenibacillus mangrovi]MCJ8013305.1 GNAT family N-acetyltransferase [Paenibacillus mangrovi]